MSSKSIVNCDSEMDCSVDISIKSSGSSLFLNQIHDDDPNTVWHSGYNSEGQIDKRLDFYFEVNFFYILLNDRKTQFYI